MPTFLTLREGGGSLHHKLLDTREGGDVTQVDKLLHGDENVVCADAGYTGVEKRSEHATEK